MSASIRQYVVFSPTFSSASANFGGMFPSDTLAGSTIAVWGFQSGDSQTTCTITDSKNSGDYTEVDSIYSAGNYNCLDCYYPNTTHALSSAQTQVTNETVGSSNSSGLATGTFLSNGPSNGRMIVPGSVTFSDGTNSFTDSYGTVYGDVFNGSGTSVGTFGDPIQYWDGTFSFSGAAHSKTITATYKYWTDWVLMKWSDNIDYRCFLAMEITGSNGTLVAHNLNTPAYPGSGTNNVDGGPMACGTGSGILIGASIGDYPTSAGTSPINMTQLYYGWYWGGSAASQGVTGPSGLFEYAHVSNVGTVNAPTWSCGGGGSDAYLNLSMMFGDASGSPKPSQFFFGSSVGLGSLAWMIDRRNRVPREESRSIRSWRQDRRSRLFLPTYKKAG